jgi:GNAT superfamily N-acetyltransferase
MQLVDGAMRAREWRRATLSAVCDEMRPWEFGVIARAHRYPGYYDLNTVIVERPTRLSAAALEEVADEALEDVAHRAIDVEPPEEAARLRPPLSRLGWRSMALVWMRYEGRPEALARVSARVEEVPYDAVAELRREWHYEDFPGVEQGEFPAQAREVALARGARVLAVLEAGRAVAYAQLDGSGAAVEVGEVFVSARHRGQGLGTAVTAAAIAAGSAAGAKDLWICADDEGRAKPLYERLGFRGLWRMTQFLRLPS